MIAKNLFAVLFGVLAVTAISAEASAQVAQLPWTSTFDRGDFSEWSGFRNATGVTVETTGCQSGSCARAPLLAGTFNDNYGDKHFGDHFTVGAAKVEEVWLRFYSRFDAGFVWPAKGQKLAIINLTDGLTSTKHYQVYVNVRPNGEYAVVHSYFTAWQFYGLLQNVGSPASVRTGQWDKIKLYVRLNTPGQANGVVRLWVNDQLKIQYDALNIREGTQYGMNKLNLSSYSNPEATANGTQWWDSFHLAITDPDASSVPKAPSNVRAD